jgi:hypothetical protein
LLPCAFHAITQEDKARAAAAAAAADGGAPPTPAEDKAAEQRVLALLSAWEDAFAALPPPVCSPVLFIASQCC